MRPLLWSAPSSRTGEGQTPPGRPPQMPQAVVTHALRTPIGKFQGQFQDLAAPELGAAAVRAVIRLAGLDPREVEEVVMGCARQAGLGPNPARQAAVRAGVPESAPSTTLNMACGSGLAALIHAARMVAAGEAHCVVAGGMESMSRVPFLLPEARRGYRMGHAPLQDAMYQDGFLCPLAGQLMGETAETLAREHGIGRDEQDAYAARSQNRVEAAEASWREEIAPVTVPGRRGESVQVATDEHPRRGVTAASLGSLPPVFAAAGGTVTAGNSSGITDGAAALLVVSGEFARARGHEPLAVIEGWASAGTDPRRMGLGPVPATERLLARIGRRVQDYELVELNEAFAAQVLACVRVMDLDLERTNVRGGAIALGHPIGATGARIVVTLLHEMRRRAARLGLATLCVSGGQGVSVSFLRS
jgi:acetyl-CoA C-acetyltransferase